MIKNRMKTDPIPVIRQHRTMRARDVTSLKMGKVVPIAAFPLLRMDSCAGRLNIAFDMNETYETLLNRIIVRTTVMFIPAVANERFERSPSIFERSFAGEPRDNQEGSSVVPFVETHAFPATAGSHEVYKALGLNAKAGTLVNTGYQEGYNQGVNFMRRQRSNALPMLDLDNGDLAAALWGPNAFSEVVPDFDDGLIAGETPLTVVQAKMPVRGVGFSGNVTPVAQGEVKETGRVNPAFTGIGLGGADLSKVVLASQSMAVGSSPDIFAELAPDGIHVSLANVDQARQLVEWAKKREGYEGHLDSWHIDSLMQGITVDELAWFQPMVIDQQITEVRQVKRMATDGASLEEGAANGVGSVSVGVNVPVNPYGGVIMIFCEAMPEQLYERQADPYWMANSVADFPNYMKDVLNPMPVVPVLNQEVDTLHSTPEGQFGWAKRNWKWGQWPTRVGGDLYAADADSATTVARRMIYPTDEANPSLTETFYLATNLGKGPFIDQDKDPIVCGIGGSIEVSGLTVIGEVHESEANYDIVRAEIPPLQRPQE